MPKNVFKTDEPVFLQGYQAIMKPSKFGYSLCTIVGEELIEKLEADRVDLIKWCESKLKNPKRSVAKPEPWEEQDAGHYRIKLSWKEEDRPPVVDAEGTPITDERTPLYEGSKVKIAFYQKPYLLKDGVTYGTSLKCLGVQVVALNGGEAGIDSGNMNAEDVAALFGTTKGYKVAEPNVDTGTTGDGEPLEDF